MSKYQTLKDVYRDAVQVQDACNMSGIAHCLIEVIRFLHDQPEYTGTAWLNRHPAVQLFTYKMADLSGVGSFEDSEGFSRAYNEAKHALAEEA